MKPRFRAEWEVSSEELCTLARWFLSRMSKNSESHQKNMASSIVDLEKADQWYLN